MVNVEAGILQRIVESPIITCSGEWICKTNRPLLVRLCGWHQSIVELFCLHTWLMAVLHQLRIILLIYIRVRVSDLNVMALSRHKFSYSVLTTEYLKAQRTMPTYIRSIDSKTPQEWDDPIQLLPACHCTASRLFLGEPPALNIQILPSAALSASPSSRSGAIPVFINPANHHLSFNKIICSSLQSLTPDTSSSHPWSTYWGGIVMAGMRVMTSTAHSNMVNLVLLLIWRESLRYDSPGFDPELTSALAFSFILPYFYSWV